jgi:hypothetical protein
MLKNNLTKDIILKNSDKTFWVKDGFGGSVRNQQTKHFLRFGLWCLTPLSTIFQLYRGGNWSTQRKPPPVVSH